MFGLVLGVISFARDGLVREPGRRVPDAARDRRSTSSSTRSCSSARRPRTSSSAARPAPCRRSSAGRRSPATSGSRRCSCSRSSSTGRRRTSGRCRCGSARTTRRPACRCCRSCKGVAETTRQIALYTILMVAISLVLWAVARMGAIYLVAAVVLGAIFLWQAYGLWRRGASEEASTAGRSGSTGTRSAT